MKGIRFEDIEKWSGKKEIEIEDLFFEKIEMMMKTLFDEEVVIAKRQYTRFVGSIKTPKGNIPKRGRRVDIFCECKSGNKYLIEIKCTTDIGEIMKAIGQLLFYSVYFPEANKMVLVSNYNEKIWEEVIKKYNLPIEFVLIGKNQTFMMKQ